MTAFLVVLLVLLSLRWIPAADVDELVFRFRVSRAIAGTSATSHEARLLMSIARYESNFSPDVAICRTTGGTCGTNGGCGVGPFQHDARTGAERSAICSSLDAAAAVALEDVRASYATCAELPEPERLGAYARGLAWRTAEARELSRTRWVP